MNLLYGFRENWGLALLFVAILACLCLIIGLCIYGAVVAGFPIALIPGTLAFIVACVTGAVLAAMAEL